MADKKQRIILSFDIDKASLKQAQAAIASLSSSFQLVGNVANQSAAQTAGAIAETATATEKAKNKVAELNDELSNRVSKSAEEVKRIIVELGNAAEIGGRKGKKAFKELDEQAAETLREFDKILTEVNDLEGEAPAAVKKLKKEIEGLNQELKQTGKQVGALPKSFDEVSKEVAAFSEVETAGRTVGGAIGVIPGLESVDRAVATLSEIPAVLEAIPRFSASIREAGTQLSTMAGGAGKAGLAVGGVAIAFTAAAIVARDIIGGLSEQTRIAESKLEGIRSAEEIIAGGDINAILEAADIAKQNLELAREQNILDKERLANAIAASNQRDDSVRGIIEGIAFDVADAFASTPLDKLKDAEKESTAAAITAAGAQDTYTQFLASTEGQALLAARALEELNQKIFTNAKTQAEAVRFRLDQEDKGVAQLEAENREREKQLQVIEAEIQAINNAGKANKETVERLNELIEAGRQVQTEMRYVTDTALPAAQALENAAKAEEERAKAAEEATKAQEQAAEEAKAAQDKIIADEVALGQKRADIVIQNLEDIANLEKAHAEELVKLAEDKVKAEQKVLADLQDKLVKLREDAGRAEADAVLKEQQKILDDQIKAQRQIVDDTQKHYQNLLDIRRKADQNEEDLAQTRDFKAIANARRNTNRQLEEAQRNFAQEQKDKAVEFVRNAEDRQRAFAQERADRFRKYQQDVYDARVQANRQRADAIAAGNQAIIDARARQIQELNDLRNSGIKALEMRRQLSTAELQLIGQMTGTGTQLLSQLSAQLASFANAGSTISNTSNINNSSTVTNTIGAINVNSGNNLGTGILQALIA